MSSLIAETIYREIKNGNCVINWLRCSDVFAPAISITQVIVYNVRTLSVESLSFNLTNTNPFNAMNIIAISI